WFRMQARQADLIVALDRVSIHAAWELAQRLRLPHAIHGVSPALALLDKHLDQPLPVAVSRAGFVPVACRRIARETRRFAIMTAKATARAAASPAVMRSRLGAHAWAALVATPGLPPSMRVKIAYRTHMNMLAADRAELALATTQAAIAHLPTPRYRAALLMREANSEAARMTPPSLSRAMTAQLELADEDFAAARHRQVAASIEGAQRLLFNRAVHFDRMSSPLMDNPGEYLAEWRRSTAVSALSSPRGRSAKAAAPPTDRPLRLLVATNSNANFLAEILQLF